MTDIKNLEPKIVWKHFDEIRKIPRCSKHEEKIREYIINFAKKQKLKYKTDKAGNIVVLKDGMKNKPTVILQGHMDMVCEKNSDVVHDFTKDPIKVKIEGDVVKAEGTTLGADNGIGLSVALAVLEDKKLKHGPIEALFTVDEETGLTGAFALENDMLTGRTMINLDSEEFGIITVGCAGGGESKIELPIETQKIDKELDSIVVKVSGLRGGHSGINIHEQRGNAIKILARMLWKANKKHKFYISEIKGGDKHNAIPREAYAKISLSKNDKNEFISTLKSEEREILEEIRPVDPDFKLIVEDIEKQENALTDELKDKIINLLHGLPHGVDKMNYDIPKLVETSTNLATIEFKEGKIVIGMSSRSSVKSELQNIRDRINAIATLAGAKVTEDKPYPGWKPNMDSKLLKIAKKVYKELFKEEPKVEAVHAGLETGIIGEKFPGMDMISIGPTIRYLHSPNEEVSIDSVRRFYNYVVKLLEVIE